MRAIFFDVSKAFDRVWHQGLLCKLQTIGITGFLLLGLLTICITESKGLSFLVAFLIGPRFRLLSFTVLSWPTSVFSLYK